MGPQHANRLETLLSQVDNGQQVVATEEHQILEDLTTARRDSEICGWVNIIYGCNERCSYCVVPSVRGKEQSRYPNAIKSEIQKLADETFSLLKQEPNNSSLQIMTVGRYWSMRIGEQNRALGVEVGDEGLLWCWIGSYADYEIFCSKLSKSSQKKK